MVIAFKERYIAENVCLIYPFPWHMNLTLIPNSS